MVSWRNISVNRIGLSWIQTYSSVILIVIKFAILITEISCIINCICQTYCLVYRLALLYYFCIFDHSCFIVAKSLSFLFFLLCHFHNLFRLHAYSALNQRYRCVGNNHPAGCQRSNCACNELTFSYLAWLLLHWNSNGWQDCCLNLRLSNSYCFKWIVSIITHISSPNVCVRNLLAYFLILLQCYNCIFLLSNLGYLIRNSTNYFIVYNWLFVHISWVKN